MRRLDQHRVYVSGGITGVLGYLEQFAEAEAMLRALGHRVVNPARRDVEGWTWADYMRRDLRWLALCTAIYTLPSWRTSPGARVEVIHALAWGLKWLR